MVPTIALYHSGVKAVVSSVSLFFISLLLLPVLLISREASLGPHIVTTAVIRSAARRSGLERRFYEGHDR